MMIKFKSHPAQPDNWAMCWDMGIGEVAAIASIASAAVGAGAAIYAGQAQSSAYKYQAQVAENNAEIAQQKAAWQTQLGEQQAVNQSLKTRALIGAQKAAQAASGIDVNTGSAVDVRSTSAELGELNALTIRSNAAREAYGYQVQATSDTAQAQLDKMEAGYASTAGFINAGSSLLGGASSAASQYSMWQLQNPSGGSIPASDFGGNSGGGTNPYAY